MLAVTPGLVGTVGSNGGGGDPPEPQAAPVNTVAPVISGSTTVGSTLTCSTGTWTGNPPPSFGYQWKRAGADIGGAVANTYVTQAADVGELITCTVTGTNVAGSASADSNAITPVAIAPVNTVAPSVSGSAPVGSTLTTTDGTWTGAPTPTYAYQWKRAGTNIGGATSVTYVTQAADAGAAISCTVTATNMAGSDSAGSSNSVTPTAAPVNTVAPAVTGSAPVGNTLSCSTGTWTGYPTPTYTYQWKKAGVDIGGETASTYVTVTGDAGSSITCTVTATNAVGSASAGSNGVTVTLAPVNTVAPVISGSLAVGSTLTTTDGTWTGSPTPTFTYQWKRAGTNIGGATASTYVTVTADAGQAITCAVTGTNTAGNASAGSNTLTPTLAPSNSVAPVISGSLPVGSTLTTTDGTWLGYPTPTYAYQWKRNGSNIAGQTANTHVTVAADVDASITCAVTATNASGNATTSSNTLVPTDPPQTALNLVIAAYASAPTAPRQTAMYNLIAGLMGTPAVAATPGVSIWASGVRAFVYRCAESQGALVNWLAPGTGNSTLTGSPAFVTDIGFTNIALNYVSTAYFPNGVTFARDNNAFAASTSLDAANVANACLAGNTQFSIEPRNNAGNYSTRNSAAGLDNAANTGSGLYLTARNNASNYSRYEAGALFDTITHASSALAATEIYVGSNSATFFSTKPTGFVWIGSYLDATAAAALNTAWAAYVAAL